MAVGTHPDEAAPWRYIVMVWAIELPEEIRYLGLPSIIGDDEVRRFCTKEVNHFTARFPTPERAEAAFQASGLRGCRDATICRRVIDESATTRPRPAGGGV